MALIERHCHAEVGALEKARINAKLHWVFQPERPAVDEALAQKVRGIMKEMYPRCEVIEILPPKKQPPWTSVKVRLRQEDGSERTMKLSSELLLGTVEALDVANGLLSLREASQAQLEGPQMASKSKTNREEHEKGGQR